MTMRLGPQNALTIQRVLTATIACLLWLGSPAFADERYYAAPETLDPDGFRDVLFKVAPGVYMAGQPTPEGLERLADAGVTRVINLRTAYEMNDRETVPYDEAAKVAALGLDYVHIPLGGPDTPYNAGAVDQLAEALAGAQGDVLLHCTVAWRASHLWTAYLVEHQGLTLEDAVEVGRQLNLHSFGLPLEDFLDTKLTYKEVE